MVLYYCYVDSRKSYIKRYIKNYATIVNIYIYYYYSKHSFYEVTLALLAYGYEEYVPITNLGRIVCSYA